MSGTLNSSLVNTNRMLGVKEEVLGKDVTENSLMYGDAGSERLRAAIFLLLFDNEIGITELVPSRIQVLVLAISTWMKNFICLTS